MASTLYLDLKQREEPWFNLRAGNVGASQAEAISSTLRSGKESARRRDLRTQLALERVVGHSLEPRGVITHDMQRGIDLESEAVARFSEQMGVLVRPCGWIQSDTLKAGVSPDGLVGMGGASDTLLEVKAPRPANHLAAFDLRQGTGIAAIPTKNRAQLIHALHVSGSLFPGIHFVSYCPLFPPELHLYHALVERDSLKEELDAYAVKLDAFLGEVDSEEARIRELLVSIKTSDVCTKYGLQQEAL
jgi:hypothetical protein